MNKNIQNSLAKRLLTLVDAKVTDMADEPMRMPISTYLDKDEWQDEIETLHKRKPLAAALSCELPEVGSFLTLTVIGTSILLTRTDQGLKAFLNVCRHRGAMVAPENCQGRQTKFSCPYHAWTYTNTGQLLSVSDSATFGEVDKSAHGLTELAVAERSGLIFVVLTPGLTFDVGEWLAGADEPLGLDDRLDDYVCVGSRVVPAGNWKLVVEGHLESYHFNKLHANSVGRFMVDNCTTLDRFGPHVQITFCQQTITQLHTTPEAEWEPLKTEMINPQFLLFPSTMVTVWHDAIIAQVIQPGSEPGMSCSRLVYAVRKELAMDDALKAKATGMLDLVADLVRDEDYAASFMIQRGLATGAQSEIIFGRNELGLMMFHASVEAQKNGLSGRTQLAGMAAAGLTA